MHAVKKYDAPLVEAGGAFFCQKLSIDKNTRSVLSYIRTIVLVIGDGMERIVLHVDANSFYASVECLYRPELAGKPVAVCGNPEERHGIVLTSSIAAKRSGVRTGMAIWQARQMCPQLVVVPPDFPLYIHFSQQMRGLYEEYSDRVEAFGLDECWVELTEEGRSFADGERIAHEIRRRVKEELGITVSVGVSFNKVFAKLGSDMKKPDAVTVIPPGDFRRRIGHLPARDLLWVGPKTEQKLLDLNIRTIGELADAPADVMRSRFGKNGLMLKAFASGEDHTPVRPSTVESVIKSVGNSTTTPHDIATLEDARCVYYLLAESVAARLRDGGFRCQCVSISIRTTELEVHGCQQTFAVPTNITGEIADMACRLFAERYLSYLPLRSVGLSCSALSPDDAPVQLDMLGNQEKRERLEQLDTALDGLRKRFGHQVVQRGVVLADSAFARINPKEEHVIHPVGFLGS